MAVVSDERVVPLLESSSSCPTLEEVMNTRLALRSRLWEEDAASPVVPQPSSEEYGAAAANSSTACVDGCMLLGCEDGRVAPCCVARKQVTGWLLPRESAETER